MDVIGGVDPCVAFTAGLDEASAAVTSIYPLSFLGV
jgi:hypothetical protein